MQKQTRWDRAQLDGSQPEHLVGVERNPSAHWLHPTVFEQTPISKGRTSRNHRRERTSWLLASHQKSITVLQSPTISIHLQWFRWWLWKGQRLPAAQQAQKKQNSAVNSLSEKDSSPSEKNMYNLIVPQMAKTMIKNRKYSDYFPEMIDMEPKDK